MQSQNDLSRPPREVDFGEFLKVLRREGRPAYLPFYEHGYSHGFFARRMGLLESELPPWGTAEYHKLFVDFWLGMGWDHIPLEIGLNCPLAKAERANSVGSESHVVIQSWEDFEKYPWPDVSNPINFNHFEMVAGLLPAGVKIVGGVGAGPYEWAALMMGVQGLSMALALDPDLVQAVFDKLGELHVSADRQIASMDFVGALRQGDDLGFKTSTFLSPDHLRQYVFPIYKRMVQTAHDRGKPFILHSCGNLEAVYDDLIDDCGFDAKHSFEDTILPVNEFKRRYGNRITPLSGLDVDMICRGSRDEIIGYTRRMIEECFADGHWALGTGNSLTDYMPVENYLLVVEEGLKVT